MSFVASLFCVLLFLGGCQDDPLPAPMPNAPVVSEANAASSAPAETPKLAPAAGVADTRPAAESPSAEEEVDDEGEADGADGACAPAGSDLKPLELLRFAFASGIEGKDPKDDLRQARRGQRVFAHMTLRNRSGRARCVHLVFRVAGKKRTEVTLKIGESWSWRTWAYNTIKSDDGGPLELTVSDDQGQVILEKTLAVTP